MRLVGHGRRVLFPVAILLSAALPVTAAQVVGPSPVSPGERGHVVVAADRCPTFSWSSVYGATGYEIAVYTDADQTPAETPVEMLGVEPILRADIEAAASSWTPPVGSCLQPGQRYVWQVREKGSIGYRDGEWSHPIRFVVDPGAASPDPLAELEALIEELRALRLELEANSAGNPLAPEVDFPSLSDITDKINAARDNIKDNTDTARGTITKRIDDKTAPILGKVEENLAKLEPIVARVEETAVTLGDDVKEMVRDALAQAEEFATAEKQGFEVFAPGGTCAVGSPCLLFRADLIDQVDGLIETMVGLLGCDIAAPSLEPVIEAIPPKVLYVVYRAMNTDFPGLGCLSLAEIRNDIETLNLALAGSASPAAFATISTDGEGGLSTNARTANRPMAEEHLENLRQITSRMLIASTVLKYLGDNMNISASAVPDVEVAAWGWAGVSIRASAALRKVSGIFLTVSDNLSKFAQRAKSFVDTVRASMVASDLEVIRAALDKDEEASVAADVKQILSELQTLAGNEGEGGLQAILDALDKDKAESVAADVKKILESVKDDDSGGAGWKTTISLMATVLNTINKLLDDTATQTLTAAESAANNSASAATFAESAAVNSESAASNSADAVTAAESAATNSANALTAAESAASNSANTLTAAESAASNSANAVTAAESAASNSANAATFAESAANNSANTLTAAESAASNSANAASSSANAATFAESAAVEASAARALITTLGGNGEGGIFPELAQIEETLEQLAVESTLVAHDAKLAGLVLRLDAVETAQVEGHIASCQPTLGLLLPASQGGRLDTVVDLVAGSIALAGKAGLKTTAAENLFANGEKQVDSKNYAAAFTAFCGAYQSLTR